MRKKRIEWENSAPKSALTAPKKAEKSCGDEDLGLNFDRARAII